MNFIHKNDNKNFSSSQDNLPHLKNEFKFEDEKILDEFSATTYRQLICYG